MAFNIVGKLNQQLFKIYTFKIFLNLNFNSVSVLLDIKIFII